MYWMLEILGIIRLEMRQLKNRLWLGYGQGREPNAKKGYSAENK